MACSLVPEYVEVASPTRNKTFNVNRTFFSVLLSARPSLDIGAAPRGERKRYPLPAILPGIRGLDTAACAAREQQEQWVRATVPVFHVDLWAGDTLVQDRKAITLGTVRSNSPKNTLFLVQVRISVLSSKFSAPFYVQFQPVGGGSSVAIGPIYVSSRPMGKRSRMTYMSQDDDASSADEDDEDDEAEIAKKENVQPPPPPLPPVFQMPADVFPASEMIARFDRMERQLGDISREMFQFRRDVYTDMRSLRGEGSSAAPRERVTTYHSLFDENADYRW